MCQIEKNTPYILFRRGEYEHMEKLFKEGEIYINTVDYIRTCDENQDRSDINDSMDERDVLHDVKITMCDMGQDINKDGITCPYDSCVINYEKYKKGNIYCLSGIYTNDLIDTKGVTKFDTKSFGEYLIVIFQPSKFIKRVKTALSEIGYEGIQYDRVDYYNDTYCGSTGIFKKNEKYSSQNEFRFYIPNVEDRAIKINIGSIENIAKMSKSFYLKFTFSNDREKAFFI